MKWTKWAMIFHSLMIGYSSMYAQKKASLEYVKPIPFPDSLISSECQLAVYGGHVSVAILSVVKGAKPAEYFTTVYTRDMVAASWHPVASSKFPEAADPWIFAFEDGLLIADISEGNKFHLKTEFINNRGRQIFSHGLGHDHAMIVNDERNATSYLVSTERLDNKIFLYVAVSNNHGRSFSNTHRHEILQDVDFSIKQPVVNSAGELLIPVVVKGSLDSERKVTLFEQMNTWIVQVTESGARVDTTVLLTTESGPKHHQLLIRDDALYYVFTNVRQDKLLVLKAEGETRFSQVLADNGWYHLDAALVADNGRLVLVYTVRVGDNQYQKYFAMLSSADLSLISKIPLGNVSKPSDDNGWVKRAWPKGGDYCGLIQDGNAFYVLWSHAEIGLFKPYVARIEIN